MATMLCEGDFLFDLSTEDSIIDIQESHVKKIKIIATYDGQELTVYKKRVTKRLKKAIDGMVNDYDSEPVAEKDYQKIAATA
jgi:hypothetical protein